MDLHHVDGRNKLVGAWQNELGDGTDVADPRGVAIMQGPLIGRRCVDQPVRLRGHETLDWRLSTSAG